MGIMSFCAAITRQMLAVDSVVVKQVQIIYVNKRENRAKLFGFMMYC